MNVLVTGASGFVGTALLRQLRAEGVPVIAAYRRPPVEPAPWPVVEVGDIQLSTDWRGALHKARQIVHLAARAHVTRRPGTAAFAEFRRVNVDGTLELARQAAAAGVRRFVFVSSVKVHGEASAPGRPWRADDPPAPTGPYAVSKHEAEVGLRRLAGQTGMELVIVRPPLVYGPSAKGNFRRLSQLARHGVPLPLGAIANRRSLIGLENLIDFLGVSLRHPEAAGRTFLVSDGQDVSTAHLYRRLVVAHGRTPRLPALPPALLQAAATMLGAAGAWQRLCGTLQVDAEAAGEQLGWRAPVGLDEGLRRATHDARAQVT